MSIYRDMAIKVYTLDNRHRLEKDTIMLVLDNNHMAFFDLSPRPQQGAIKVYGHYILVKSKVIEDQAADNKMWPGVTVLKFHDIWLGIILDIGAESFPRWQ